MQFNNVIIYGGTFNQGSTFNHFDSYSGFESNSKILQLLRPRGYIDYFSIHQSARLPDTCHWSLTNLEIYTWLTSDAPEASRLWLHGNPGTGKSVLAAFLMEQVQRTYASRDEIVLPYFCKAAGSEKDRSVRVLMAFIRCCLTLKSYDMEVATRLAQKMLGEREDYQFTREEMEPYLSLFLGKFRKIWFIIDGIDECEDAISLIEALERIGADHSKVLLISRKESHIFEQLLRWPSLELGAEDTTAEDIQTFIDEQLRRLIRDRPILKPYADQVKDHLSKTTGVMFLYARLKCETIREADPSTEAHIAEILNSLDGRLSTLDALYENYLLQRLSSNNEYRNEVALRTLQWIKCSPNPVTSTFLLRALALDFHNDKTISSDNLDTSVKSTIWKALGVLVEWQGREPACYAALIHHSLREYLSRLASNPPQWEELSVPYNSIAHEPAHLAVLAACCIVTRTPLVWSLLQGYHDSGDQRRKLSDDRPRSLRRQLAKEEPWYIWEQRQRLELDLHWIWRKEEAKSAQSDLADVPEELQSLEWVKNRRKQLQMIQSLESQKVQELHQLVGLTTMRERDLMMYSFECLAYHLAEAGKSGNVQLTGAINCLIPQMRIYAANIFSDIDLTQANGALQAASLVDLAVSLASFAEVMDLFEHLVQYNPINVHDWRWISSLLYFQISRFPLNQASNATSTWDPAILESLKTKEPPFLFTQLFALVTTSINDLRNVEYALCNYDKNVSALVGAGILIHALRQFERLLAQWMIFHSLEYIEPHLLSKDHLLFPKILTKPIVRPTTQPDGKPISSHPTYSFLALLLCLVASAWSLNPLRMAILFSLSTKRSRYSFQLRSPFWTVYQNIPLLLPWPITHWILSECSIYQLVLIAGVVALLVASASSKVLRSGFVPAFTKQTINRFLIDQSLYESYFIVYLCYRDRLVATQLNMILVYFVLYDLVVSTVDPAGLRRARAHYCGDIPIVIQTEHVHNLVQNQPDLN
ncbi:hypothetical protein BYT27DRAFT_7147448 [Phlegmacium glaucopus]|nr:hypothetical protein BYT27DRAFT_7147448 [Phlegmacium glaucopus]